jgi:hypothetical protein
MLCWFRFWYVDHGFWFLCLVFVFFLASEIFNAYDNHCTRHTRDVQEMFSDFRPEWRQSSGSEPHILVCSAQRTPALPNFGEPGTRQNEKLLPGLASTYNPID